MKSIILDTDIGDDIDDALALAMLLGLGEIDLRGVVTVHGEVELRTRIAAKMLVTNARLEVPVATGISQPMNREPRLGWAQSQGQCLSGDEVFTNCVNVPGVEFMRDLLEAAETPTTLLAIGPLTNVARLLLDYPAAAARIDELVIMGGLFGRPHPEYNILMDPDAAQIVFDAGLDMRVIPFDVTEHCLMETELMDALAEDERPPQQLLWKLIGYWQKKDGRNAPVLHDPLAVGCLVAPEFFTFEPYAVKVSLDRETYGVTLGARDERSRTQVCTGVNLPAFQELFRTLVLSEQPTKGGDLSPW